MWSTGYCLIQQSLTGVKMSSERRFIIIEQIFTVKNWIIPSNKASVKIKCSYTAALRTEEPQNHRKILLKLLNLNSSARNSGECWLRVWKAQHQEALPLHLVYSQQSCQALGPWGCSPPFLYKPTLSCPPFTSPSSAGTKQWGDILPTIIPLIHICVGLFPWVKKQMFLE